MTRFVTEQQRPGLPCSRQRAGLHATRVDGPGFADARWWTGRLAGARLPPRVKPRSAPSPAGRSAKRASTRSSTRTLQRLNKLGSEERSEVAHGAAAAMHARPRRRSGCSSSSPCHRRRRCIRRRQSRRLLCLHGLRDWRSTSSKRLRFSRFYSRDIFCTRTCRDWRRRHQVVDGNPRRSSSTPRSFAARCAMPLREPSRGEHLPERVRFVPLAIGEQRLQHSLGALRLRGLVGPRIVAESTSSAISTNVIRLVTIGLPVSGSRVSGSTISSSAMALHGREPCEVRLPLGDESQAVVRVAVFGDEHDRAGGVPEGHRVCDPQVRVRGRHTVQVTDERDGAVLLSPPARVARALGGRAGPCTRRASCPPQRQRDR